MTDTETIDTENPELTNEQQEATPLEGETPEDAADSADMDSARLAGIYELPERLPENMGKIARKAEHLVTRKRTIGQVDYEEQIFGASARSMEKHPLPRQYRWVARPELGEITLSGPHRKWIEELLDVHKLKSA